MGNTSITKEQWDRLVNNRLAHDEMPEVYAYLALHPEEQERLTSNRSGASVNEAELALLMTALDPMPPLTLDEAAAYLEGALGDVERECLESRFEIDPVGREEMRQMALFRQQLDALPKHEIAPLRSNTVTDSSEAATLSESWLVEFHPGSNLTGKIRDWLNEVVKFGIVTPIYAVQEKLTQIQQMAALAPSPALRGDRPDPLSPRFTAIRSRQPVLRWKGLPNVYEYTVVLARQKPDTEAEATNRPEIIWKQVVTDQTETAIPKEVVLEPGNVYAWQVTATVSGERKASPSAWFVLLTEEEITEIEAEEQEHDDSAVIRIGICEAYGLYDEALVQAQNLAKLNPSNEIATRILEQLAARRNSEGTAD